MAKKKFITFHEIIFTDKKTKAWEVRSLASSTLGLIKWYTPWRRYAFFPGMDTIFDAACLKDIIVFITFRMEERVKETLAPYKDTPSPS